MKIPLIALCTVSPLHIGGAETNMLQIARHLKDKFQIIIIGPMSPAFQKNITDLGIRNIHIPMASKFSVTTIIRLTNIFRREKVDIVHTHDSRGGLLGRLAAKMVKIKVVHTVHMPAFFQTTMLLKRLLYDKMESLLNRKFSDRVIFVSNNIKEICIRRGLVSASKAIYIPNGIALYQFKEIRKNRQIIRERVLQKLGLSKSDIIGCWAGRITKQKGLDYFINAVMELGKSRSVKYVIVGDGPDGSQIKNLVHKYGLTNQFIFTGFVNQKEVYEYMGCSDFFVFPSRYECLPYAILEAMAVGLPCIVSDVGGNRELVEDGYNGYVVPLGDTRALAEAIGKLLDSPDIRKRFGENSTELSQKYDEINMIKKVEEIYHSLLT